MLIEKSTVLVFSNLVFRLSNVFDNSFRTDFVFKWLIKVLICENQVFPKCRQRNQSGIHRIEYAWHFGLAGKPTARTLNVPDNHNYLFFTLFVSSSLL